MGAYIIRERSYRERDQPHALRKIKCMQHYVLRSDIFSGIVERDLDLSASGRLAGAGRARSRARKPYSVRTVQ